MFTINVLISSFVELSLSITCVAVALKGSLSTPYNFSSSANCPAQTLESCLELEHIPDQRLENQQSTILVKKINGKCTILS